MTVNSLSQCLKSVLVLGPRMVMDKSSGNSVIGQAGHLIMSLLAVTLLVKGYTN